MDERPGVQGLKSVFKILAYTLGIILSLWALIVFYLSSAHPDITWDWDSINTSDIHFPSSFAWGTATAAHQVEGNNSNNNWYQWEKAVYENGISRIHNNDSSAMAADHWNRYPEDILLMKNLGVSHYRFSVEWSRIEPEEGEWNEDAIEVYSAMVDSLLAKGIEPMITLHHFSHPIWFEEKGGFYERNNLPYFVDYCARIYPYYADRVNKWCTVNEPDVFSIMGYHMGMFPPGKRSPVKAIRVMTNVMIAHGEVYHRLKEINPNSYIGLAKNVTIFDPYRRWNLLHWLTSFALNYIWNGAIISALSRGRMYGKSVHRVKKSADFIGLNYYTHVLTSPFLPQTTEIDLPSRKHETITEFGYPMYAEGLERATKWLQKLSIPIEITENGVADAEDKLRPIHLKRHLWVIGNLISNGADIRSYYHWSLMDNFEWAEGYSMRFGLYEVDYESQTRSLRESGKIYQQIIRDNNA